MKTARPEAGDLLAIARQELLDTLLPEVSGALKYQVLMTANAMKIAGREIDAGESTEKQSLASIRTLYADLLPESANNADEHTLADDIRHRKLANDHEQLYDLLLGITRSKLLISNPKYLKDH
ncbi:MAG: DUF6285 domain-containing protein [Marinobacter sp.]|uniref:DUF6285 domain-containing protein n=1 Tax=Marinobacter sp. TaxID=50741 RepID=UPI0034A09BF5